MQVLSLRMIYSAIVLWILSDVVSAAATGYEDYDNYDFTNESYLVQSDNYDYPNKSYGVQSDNYDYTTESYRVQSVRKDETTSGCQYPCTNCASVYSNSSCSECAKGYFLGTNKDICQMSEDKGWECLSSKSWYFSSEESKCRSFNYEGCGGNSNIYSTKNDCEKQCLYLSSYKCLMPVDKGWVCQGNTMWFFNYEYKECEHFSYSGCGGNSNKFESKLDCIRQCLNGNALQAPTCVNCTEFSKGCKSCERSYFNGTDFSCTSCDEGYLMVQDKNETGICRKCSTGCATCELINVNEIETKCTKCSEQYSFIGNECYHNFFIGLVVFGVFVLILGVVGSVVEKLKEDEDFDCSDCVSCCGDACSDCVSCCGDACCGCVSCCGDACSDCVSNCRDANNDCVSNCRDSARLRPIRESNTRPLVAFTEDQTLTRNVQQHQSPQPIRRQPVEMAQLYRHRDQTLTRNVQQHQSPQTTRRHSVEMDHFQMDHKSPQTTRRNPFEMDPFQMDHQSQQTTRRNPFEMEQLYRNREAIPEVTRNVRKNKNEYAQKTRKHTAEMAQLNQTRETSFVSRKSSSDSVENNESEQETRRELVLVARHNEDRERMVTSILLSSDEVI